MCFNSSSSSKQSTKVYDERVGSDNGSTSFRADGTNTISVGSDDTAQMAIESSTNALTVGTEFINSALTNFLNMTDTQLERADKNVASNQALNAELLMEQEESADDRLMNLLKYGLLAGVGITALKTGLVKDIVGAFK